MELETYFTDAVRLVLPAGYTDRSLNLFFPPNPKDRGFSFTVGREPRTDGTLVEQAETVLERLQASLKGIRIVGRRERSFGVTPAYEVRLRGKVDTHTLYQRIAFVDHHGTFLIYTATSPRAHKQRCDALADQWFDSLRFSGGDA